MRRYCKILHISYYDRVIDEEVCAKIQRAIGPNEDLTVEKRRKVKLYGHVSHTYIGGVNFDHCSDNCLTGTGKKLSLNRSGRWCTTNDFTNSFLHFSLFSNVLWQTILQGTVKGGRRQGKQRKREDNIREWTDLEFAKSQRINSYLNNDRNSRHPCMQGLKTLKITNQKSKGTPLSFHCPSVELFPSLFFSSFVMIKIIDHP